MSMATKDVVESALRELYDLGWELYRARGRPDTDDLNERTEALLARTAAAILSAGEPTQSDVRQIEAAKVVLGGVGGPLLNQFLSALVVKITRDRLVEALGPGVETFRCSLGGEQFRFVGDRSLGAGLLRGADESRDATMRAGVITRGPVVLGSVGDLVPE